MPGRSLRRLLSRWCRLFRISASSFACDPTNSLGFWGVCRASPRSSEGALPSLAPCFRLCRWPGTPGGVCSESGSCSPLQTDLRVGGTGATNRQDRLCSICGVRWDGLNLLPKFGMDSVNAGVYPDTQARRALRALLLCFCSPSQQAQLLSPLNAFEKTKI